MDDGSVAHGLVLGIGVDSVDIEEMARFCVDREGSFARRTFSASERAEAYARADWASVLAGKFAVKEAVFKALAWRTAEGFDFRAVETLEDANGRPCVTMGEGTALAPVFAEAGVRELLVSITNERGLATAFVLAQ